MRKIEVVDYSYEWPKQFEEIKSYLNTVLKDKYDIVHVGSTSVEGLAAKPIIDVVIIAYRNDLPEIKDGLSKLGYTHNGNQGIEGREAFKGNDSIKEKLPTHHLYSGAIDCVAIQNFLHLKRFLSENPDYVEAYGNLKKENAKKYPNDIDMYIQEKSSLIAEILLKSGMNVSDVKSIEKANKTP